MSDWLPDIALRPGPRYLAIVAAIADAIDDGRLRPGDRLPPRRRLAWRLQVSVQTVSAAYVEAERRGLVVGEVGRGTFIQSRGGGEEARFIMQRRQADVIDLSICRPARAPNHVERLRQLFAELSADADMDPMLACRPLVGMDRHRAAAARWLEGLGVPAAPERVVITNGCAHALLVALATLTEPGNLVLTDRLTDHGLISLATVLHFRLRGLPCDGEGILPEAFEQACRAGDVKVLVTTPTLNNPTSTLMGADRRRRIAAIAEAHGVAVVEDDVFRPLVADPPPTLASFLPDLAFHITSFTKSTVSGLRTGYLTAPAGTIERLTARVRTTSWMASALLAEIATRWIEDGTARDMAAWQRNELAARQAIAAEVLAGQQIAAHPTGINAWLTLPGDWRADNFVAQLRLQGVAAAASEPFVVGRHAQPHAVRLSLGAPATRGQLREGLDRVAALLQQSPEPALLTV